jgi:hypothetical protein
VSLQQTKQNLIKLLDDEDNKVIALSGEWGVGKSHLWDEVQQSANDTRVRGAISVSLFGLSDMNQLKLKAVQSAILRVEQRSAAMDQIRTGFKFAKKALEGLNRGFSALDELALLAVPSVLNDKVIVLDDIERKNDKLSIDEVLGFINEFTQQHGSRFVLILNDDQLAKRDVWDTLREKVIDQELRLLTTSQEAFDIAIKLTPSSYSAWIKEAVKSCALNNIRIIRKVIRAVNRILEDRQLEGAVLARVIPSIVLLAAINFKGFKDGPDFQFVLAAGSEYDVGGVDETDELKARWRLLLRELGINSSDEFEVLVVDFLESGQFDAGAVSKVVERYAAEIDEMRAREKSREFMMRFDWDQRLSEADLVEQAKKLVPSAKHLDPYTASHLCWALSQLSGGKDVGEAIVHGWLDWFRTQQNEVYVDNLYDRPVHPDIKAEFAVIQGRAQAKMTVFDACMHIIEHNGWGTPQEVAMKTATAGEFESTIRSLDADDLRSFMRRMLEMRLQRQLYDPHFGSATERFVEACRNIVLDPASGRLGTLIKNLFISANIGAEVEPPAAPIAAGSASPAVPPSEVGV